MYFETRSAQTLPPFDGGKELRKKYGVLIKSPEFIYGDSLLPPASCLRPPASLRTDERGEEM